MNGDRESLRASLPSWRCECGHDRDIHTMSLRCNVMGCGCKHFKHDPPKCETCGREL